MPPCEGGYKEFKIGDLFDVPTCSKKISKKDTIVGGTIPIYSSDTTNNGIVGYCNHVPHWKTSSSTPRYLIFGDHTRSFNIAENDFCVADNVKVLVPKSILSNYCLLYIIAVWKKAIPNLGYARHWSKAKDVMLRLPIDSTGEIDFQFMESRIRELEEERMRELEAYLTAAGFADCSLSPAEEEALRKFSNGEVKSNIFKVGALFSARTGDVDLQNKDINGRGEYFVNSGTQNFGIKGRTDRPARIFSANTLTIDFFGNVNYRPYKYKMATHNHVFSLSGESIKNEPIGLYFAVAMNYMSKLFSFNNMGTWNVIKDLKVNLPCTSFGEIDYDFMETYISAIKKQIIQQLKDFIAKEHTIYQQVINQ